MVRWAASLVDDPESLAERATEDRSLRLALCGLILRRVGDGEVLLQISHNDRPFAGHTWAKCLALAILTRELWVGALEGAPDDTPLALLTHLLADYPVPQLLERWLMERWLDFSDRCWSPQPNRDRTRQRQVQCLPLVWFVARYSGCSVYRVMRKLAWSDVVLSAADVAAIESLAVIGEAPLDWSSLRARAEFHRLGGSDADWLRIVQCDDARHPRLSRFPLDPEDDPDWRYVPVIDPTRYRETCKRSRLITDVLSRIA